MSRQQAWISMERGILLSLLFSHLDEFGARKYCNAAFTFCKDTNTRTYIQNINISTYMRTVYVMF